MKAIVIGAGVGGLAAALALKAHGVAVQILEQAPEIREVGAGLQISPNGLAVLRALGVEAGLARIAVRGQATVLRDYRRTAEVLRMDLTGAASPGRFYYVHRADLIDLLARAVRAEGVQISLLQEVAKVTPGTSPRLHMANGADMTADLIIGADGLHSAVRHALNGEDAPVFTGQVAWRALVPSDGSWPDEAHVQMGPGRHMVTYPLRGGQLINIVAVQERRAWVAEGWSHQDDPDNLRAAFADFGGRAAKLLPQVTDAGLWGLFRHPVAKVWQRDNVALMGDAAHPTLPFLAQGANLALEDAWVLAACLGSGRDDPAAALARYQNARRDRAVRVIEAANGNAWKFHLESPLLRNAAQLGLRLVDRVAPDRMLRGFDWLYRLDVTAGGPRELYHPP